MNVLVRHWRTGTGKPKSRSSCFDPFSEGQCHICHLPLTPHCELMTTHDNVAVYIYIAAIVSVILNFEHFPLNVWQCVNVTKVVWGHPKLFCPTPPLVLPICQMWSLHLTRRHCKGSWNTANLRGAPKTTGDLCTPTVYLVRTKSQICCRPKGYVGSARTVSVPKENAPEILISKIFL